MDKLAVLGLVVVMVGLLAVLVKRWPTGLAVFGGLMFVAGQVLGLGWAPKERMMGDVGRILYVHVPAAWFALVAFTVALVCALGVLFAAPKGDGKAARLKFPLGWDSALEASVEVGVLFNGLLLVLGSIFARPTWGTWWAWEGRLTASLVMFLTFVGVAILRQIVEDADRRSLWSAVATVLAFVNIPIVYTVVWYLPGMHQTQSRPDTMSSEMVLVLRLNAFSFMYLMAWFMVVRSRIARARTLASLPAEPAPGGAS